MYALPKKQRLGVLFPVSAGSNVLQCPALTQTPKPMARGSSTAVNGREGVGPTAWKHFTKE